MKTAIDLFCGSGAVTLGLKNAGFQVLGAIDRDPIACTTYRLNHPEVKLIEQDIKDADPACFNECLDGHLDLLVVCAPCQPFSSRYRGKKKKDGRVHLLLESLRFIEALSPKVIFFENVPGLESNIVFKKLVKNLKKMKFSLIPALQINASELGVPQKRKRIILIGAANKRILNNLENITPRTRMNVYEAIGELPTPPVGVASKRGDQLHYARKHSQLNIERLKHIPPDGGSRDALPEHLQLDCHKKLACGKNTYSDSYGRLKWKDVAPTLTTGCTDITKGRYAHPVQNRAITLREAARIQSFPDEYVFSGNHGQIATQIGNAVPPKMMEEIARLINQALSK